MIRKTQMKKRDKRRWSLAVGGGGGGGEGRERKE